MSRTVGGDAQLRLSLTKLTDQREVKSERLNSGSSHDKGNIPDPAVKINGTESRSGDIALELNG